MPLKFGCSYKGEREKRIGLPIINWVKERKRSLLMKKDLFL